jgi:hypothetical protein
MVAMAKLRETIIRFLRLLDHLIGIDLAGDIEKGGNRLVVAPLEWGISYYLRVLQIWCQEIKIDSRSVQWR